MADSSSPCPGPDRSRETSSLWEQIVSAQSEQKRVRLREEVVLLNIPVARGIAARYRSRGLALDDLQQVACLGLVLAVQRFDPGVGKDFLSYAVPTISGEVKRHFRDHGWMVRPPRRVQELFALVGAGDDVGACVRSAFSPASLDAPLGTPGASASMGDLLSSGDDAYADLERALVLDQALRSLSPTELLILRRRFCDDRSQREIGVELGVSQMQISRLLAGILDRLRSVLEPWEAELDRSA